MAAISAWGQLRDFRRFASHDYFHANIEIVGEIPRHGARLIIVNRIWFFRSTRVGKIVRWREGDGFAFSDLSRNDSRRSFPHVLSMRVRAITEKSCELDIRVGGKWTAPTPRWVGKLWLRWVFGHVVRSVDNELLWFALQRRRVDSTASSPAGRRLG